MEKSKYYYDYKRRVGEELIYDMLPNVDKSSLEIAKERNIPNYYIGSVYGYEARKVVEDWNLSYNVGTAVTYLLRAGKKHEQGMSDNDKHIEDLNKAINHLKFEIEKLDNER